MTTLMDASPYRQRSEMLNFVGYCARFYTQKITPEMYPYGVALFQAGLDFVTPVSKWRQILFLAVLHGVTLPSGMGEDREFAYVRRIPKESGGSE
jgi:hypothetical protein